MAQDKRQHCDFSGMTPDIVPSLDHDEVRQGPATEAEVEMVCRILEADYPGIEERARAILAAIFEEGGEGS